MEIKNCPFCGGDAKVISINNFRPLYTIACSNIKCISFCGFNSINFETKEGIIEAWNKRV